MSKEYIMLILYLLGWMLFALWLIGSKEFISEWQKKIDSDPELSVIPENFLRAVTYIVLLIVSIFWPWIIVKSTVGTIYKFFFKKKPKENK